MQRRWYSVANWIDYSKSANFRPVRIAITEIPLPKAGLMTNQLATIIDNLNEIDDFNCPPFCPNKKRIILECREAPPNLFRLDENPEIPILMIAAGSGIAPFLGFLERNIKSFVRKSENNLRNIDWFSF